MARILFIIITVLLTLNGTCYAAEYTLGMDSETSCTKTHYYEDGDVFIVSANGMVHNGNCPMTFIQSGTWHTNNEPEPCVSVCIKILSYTMSSCKIKMAYHDGLNDFNPQTFDCHLFPPVLWCSSKNDLKLSVNQMKNYSGKNYAITLEVKPFCGDLLSTEASVISEPQSDPSPMGRTVIIIGAVVGTISILFVIGWLMYCYRKQRHPEESASASSSSQMDRNRSNQAAHQNSRYTAVDRNAPSSQSSSDRGNAAAYRERERLPHPHSAPVMSDRSLYSPFQPPNRGTPYSGADRGPPFYNDIDQGQQSGRDKWYPMTTLGPPQSEPLTFSQPAAAIPFSPQGTNQYHANQGQGFRPQFFTEEQEMHTAPTDTKYVVYDFDFPRPMERTHSVGRNRHSPLREPPVRDPRPREITPLRETVRVIDSTTTDHTSDNDSSISDTTEDDTTDDQLPPSRLYLPGRSYMYGPQVGHWGPDAKLKDPLSFQPSENTTARTAPPNVPSFSRYIQPGPAGTNIDELRHQQQQSARDSDNCNQNLSKQSQLRVSDSPSSKTNSTEQSTLQPNTSNIGTDVGVSTSREPPVPQVPPIPQERVRPQPQPQVPPSSREYPWPQGPPPPYSKEETHLV